MTGSTRFWLLLVGAVVLVTILAGGAGTDGPPLDPRSVNPDGARGVVEVLEDLGATVVLDSAVPEPAATSALLLQDRLTAPDRELVREWVGSGRVLVVADPGSPLAARPEGFAAPVLGAEPCTIPALTAASEITGGGRTFRNGDQGGCFGSSGRPYIVAERIGAGTIVSVGSPLLFTNAELDERDNAYVAAALLAPTPGDARIAFVAPSQVDFGDGSLTSRVPTRVRNAIIMALASFLLYALYRMRRLGHVVREPLPVQIQGSELVLQAGVLSERSADPAGAARVIRDDFVERWRRTANEPTLDLDALTRFLAAHGGVDRDALHAALTRTITSEEALVSTVATLDAVDRIDEPKGTP